MPLYYWYKDVVPGDATGQNVGQVWFVLGPDGSVIGNNTSMALDGNALVNERCTVCHSRDRIDNATHDRAGWQATVDRMISYGAQLNADERQAVIDYLSSM